MWLRAEILTKEFNLQQPFWLDPKPVVFPPTELAMTDPDGLLAIGGALTPEWILQAYSHGIFPWFNEDEPILWWTPNPRSVLFVDQIKIRRSLKKVMRQNKFEVTFDTCFQEVMRACASIPRKDQNGTWIHPKMIQAYSNLHQKGHAHSVEVWQNGELVGGLYGMAIGKVFFGESMFSRQADTSKIALVTLAKQLEVWGFRMIDTQVETPHLKSMGAVKIPRHEFEAILQQDSQRHFPARQWQMEIDIASITSH